MRAPQLMQIFQQTVTDDKASPNSIVDFFLGNNLRGGWEAWLQVQYARWIFQAPQGQRPSDFDREVHYPAPNGNLICDIWFQGQGVGIWIELKTQRRANYANTVADFGADIAKIQGLNAAFRAANVNVAAAIFELAAADRPALNAMRLNPGHVRFWRYNLNAPHWTDVTQTILQVPNNVLIIAAYSSDWP